MSIRHLLLRAQEQPTKMSRYCRLLVHLVDLRSLLLAVVVVRLTVQILWIAGTGTVMPVEAAWLKQRKDQQTSASLLVVAVIVKTTE